MAALPIKDLLPPLPALKDWLPQEFWQGPPLPEFLNILWPWYKPPGAEFKVSDLVISPAEVSPGQVVTISCTVTNIGAEAGTKTIECRLEGVKMAEQTVTLQPGESKTVSFEVTPTEIKAYSVSVDGLTGTFNVIGVADIRVENLVISPAEVIIGEVVTISCTATNYGTAAGSRVITCLVS